MKKQYAHFKTSDIGQRFASQIMYSHAHGAGQNRELGPPALEALIDAGWQVVATSIQHEVGGGVGTLLHFVLERNVI